MLELSEVRRILVFLIKLLSFLNKKKLVVKKLSKNILCHRASIVSWDSIYTEKWIHFCKIFTSCCRIYCQKIICIGGLHPLIFMSFFKNFCFCWCGGGGLGVCGGGGGGGGGCFFFCAWTKYTTCWTKHSANTLSVSLKVLDRRFLSGSTFNFSYRFIS